MASRFEIARMNVVNKKGLLAFFDFVDNKTGMKYNEFALRKTKNGPFAFSASKSYENKDGETKYISYVEPMRVGKNNDKHEHGVAYMEHITKLALAKYEEEGGNKTTDSDKASKSSGSGPVTTEPENEWDDDLPF